MHQDQQQQHQQEEEQRRPLVRRFGSSFSSLLSLDSVSDDHEHDYDNNYESDCSESDSDSEFVVANPIRRRVSAHTLPVPDCDDEDEDDEGYYLKVLQPYRRLRPKRVAVIVDRENDNSSEEEEEAFLAHGIICASVLSKDGHDVSVFQHRKRGRETQRPASSSASFVQHPDFTVEEQEEKEDDPLRRRRSSSSSRQRRYNRECEKRFGVRRVLRGAEIVRIREVQDQLDGKDQEEQNGSRLVVVEYSCDNDNDHGKVPSLSEESSSQSRLLREERFDFAVFVNDAVSSSSSSSPYLPPKYRRAVGDGSSRCNGNASLLYRGMISPDAPKAAFLTAAAAGSTNHRTTTTTIPGEEDGGDDGAFAVARACYLRSVWLSTMLYGEMKLPSRREGQQPQLPQSRGSSRCRGRHNNSSNNNHEELLLLRDLGLDPLRFCGRNRPSLLALSVVVSNRLLRCVLEGLLLLFFSGFFFLFCSGSDSDDYCDNDCGDSSYHSFSSWSLSPSQSQSSSSKADYRGILDQVRARRKIAQKEGWAMPLVPVRD